MNLKDNINLKISLIFGITIAVFIDLILSKLMANWSYSWLPVQASKAAPYVDNLFAFETGIAKSVLVVTCIGLSLWFKVTVLFVSFTVT